MALILITRNRDETKVTERNEPVGTIKRCIGYSGGIIIIDALLNRYFPTLLPFYSFYRSLIPLSGIGIFRYILLFLNAFVLKNHKLLYGTPATLLLGIIAISFEVGYAASGDGYYGNLTKTRKEHFAKSYGTGIGVKGDDRLQIVLFLIPLLWAITRSEFPNFSPSQILKTQKTGEASAKGEKRKQKGKKKQVDTEAQQTPPQVQTDSNDSDDDDSDGIAAQKKTWVLQPTMVFSSSPYNPISYAYPKEYNKLLPEGKTFEQLAREKAAEVDTADRATQKPQKSEKEDALHPRFADLDKINYHAHPHGWRNTSHRAQGLPKDSINPLQERQALSIFGPSGRTVFKDEKKLDKELSKRLEILHKSNPPTYSKRQMIPAPTTVFGPIEGAEITFFNDPKQIKSILAKQPSQKRNPIDEGDDIIPPVTLLNPPPHESAIDLSKKSQIKKQAPDSPDPPITPCLIWGPTSDEPIQISTEKQLTSTLDMAQIHASLAEDAEIEREYHLSQGQPPTKHRRSVPKQFLIYGVPPGGGVTYIDAESRNLGKILQPVTEEERNLPNETEEEREARIEFSRRVPGTVVFSSSSVTPVKYVTSGKGPIWATPFPEDMNLNRNEIGHRRLIEAAREATVIPLNQHLGRQPELQRRTSQTLPEIPAGFHSHT